MLKSAFALLFNHEEGGYRNPSVGNFLPAVLSKRGVGLA